MRIWKCVYGLLAAATLWAGPVEVRAEELVVVTPGGIFEKALKENFFEPFTKETGIKVIAISSGSNEQWAKLKAMQEAGKVEWDIVNSSPNESIKFADMLAKIDCAKLPNIEKHGLPGTCSENGIVQISGAGVMAWNTEKYPKDHQPKDWADFFNVKEFPGSRALMDNGAESWMMMLALMADGVPADKLFPLDVERAAKKLEELKPNIVSWWKTGDQSQNLMRSGEADMSIMWSGRAVALMKEGAPVSFTFNQAIRDPGIWSIAKDAPNKDAAMKFFDFFILNPSAHLAFSKAVVYDTPNKEAAAQVPEADRPFRASTPENWARQAVPDWAWIAAHQDELQKRFMDVISK